MSNKNDHNTDAPDIESLPASMKNIFAMFVE
jgi:hypothetical protein